MALSGQLFYLKTGRYFWGPFFDLDNLAECVGSYPLGRTFGSYYQSMTAILIGEPVCCQFKMQKSLAGRSILWTEDLWDIIC
jgi:hypothetical protein